MDDRNRAPDEGALTGATGSLTPDDPDEAFVPAETREISDPRSARDVTASAHRRRQARQGEVNAPGQEADPDQTSPASGSRVGYGSPMGLSEDDPAYAQEEQLPEPRGREGPGENVIGGDVVRSPDDEHL